MASEAVSTAILIVAGVIVATAIVSAIYSQASLMSSAVRIASRISEDRIRTEVRIVHVAVNSSVDGGYLLIFIKNIGSRGIAQEEISKSDIYIGSETCSSMYLYSPEPTQNRWSFTIVDSNGDNVWSPGETLIVRVFNSTAIKPPICTRIVLPNGVGHESLSSP
ncbi:MAG: hypothetical protein QXV81_03070 [Ignisphaera sp.]